MTPAAYFFLSLVWLTVAGLVGLYLVQRSPKRRKPVDELEAADAALRNRIVDLEDKFESYTKREAVRGMRARKDAADDAQQALPVDRNARLSLLREKARAVGLTGR
mgnify:CR=1 FL=1